MYFKLELDGEIDETKLSALFAVLAGDIPSLSVCTTAIPNTVVVATSNAGKTSSSDMAHTKAPKAIKLAVAEPVATEPVATEPPGDGHTLEQLKELVVLRCTPDAENKLEVKAAMEIIRSIVHVKLFNDIPAEFVEACYAAIHAA